MVGYSLANRFFILFFWASLFWDLAVRQGSLNSAVTGET